jgi:glycosyltransferase involved in cell wall biosynthesis
MIALFTQQLAPYRVSLYNSLNAALDGELTVVLSRQDPPGNRLWTIPWSDVGFRTVVLPGSRIDIGRRSWEVSRGVAATLAELRPRTVMLTGWDVHACWSALRWSRRKGVPAVAWVASAQSTGVRRGAGSTAVRRRFLGACSAAVVPGVAAEAFVRQLVPALPCYHAPNAVDVPDLRAIGDPPPDGAALFIGELSRRKGVDLILAAAAEILDIFPRLIIAGDGPLRGDVVALAARLPGLDYVGFVEGLRKRQLFEQAAVVLIPSRRDAGPMVATEALVGLRPVVMGPGACAAPDLRRIAGEAVSVMPAATPLALVDAITRAKAHAVPPELRAAYTPDSMAAGMAAAARAATSGRVPAV